jgi:amino acid transporter
MCGCSTVATQLCLSTFAGAVLTKTSNLTPFAPFGFNGIFRGASMVFFAYLGFEVRRRQAAAAAAAAAAAEAEAAASGTAGVGLCPAMDRAQTSF